MFETYDYFKVHKVHFTLFPDWIGRKKTTMVDNFGKKTIRCESSLPRKGASPPISNPMNLMKLKANNGYTLV